ncbi:MAG: RadC family protein [Oscillospiraceae bacterium]|nr:RadC family protein [Oscillospiraceae bacterium]
MSVHQGHRARVKERFSREGLDGFNEHQVLELLLFYAIPQRDTNEIAHNLLNRFGSLPQVIDAPVKELKKVAGMGENAAVFLSLIKQLERYYHVKRSQQTSILNSLDQCGEYLVPFFNGLANETVYLLCLDAKRKVISCREIEEGDVNSTRVSIRKIVDVALTEKASSVVLAHNHTSGVAVPSEDDVLATYRIAGALQFVDVVLLDHVVVADNDFVSMVHSNYFNPVNIPSLMQEGMPCE